MRKYFLALATLLSTLTSTSLSAECCQSYELGIGWRRDDIHWKSQQKNNCVCYEANSDLKFRNVQSYLLDAKAKFCDEAYYIRLDGDFGWTMKGRCDEKVNVESPYISVTDVLNNHVRRQSETMDFSGAAGYPITFDILGCNSYVVPLVGFSWHRQRLRVHDDRVLLQEFSSSYDPCCSSSFSSSSFYCSSDDCYSPDSSNPLGLHPHSNKSQYRFTWYGPFIGMDGAYAFDDTWTVFGSANYHFLTRAHAKRDSNLGMNFIDREHRQSYGYGFTGEFGTTLYYGIQWYSTLNVDFRWFKSTHKHDELNWSGIGFTINLGRMF